MTTTYLDLYFIQTQLAWENVNANLLRLTWHIQHTQEQSLIVLPEMFATGFTMNPQVNAQTMDGLAVKWMKEMSVNRCICGSLSIEEKGHYFNRFLAVSNGEIIAQYDKKHLFSYGNENEHYQAGNRTVQFEYQGFKIAPYVCYDLRFPEWIRLNAGVDLIVFVANWPKARMDAWNALLKARAIENQCYVVGVNRIGDDGNGIAHSGHSQLLDFMGQYMIEPQIEREVLLHQVIEKKPLESFRLKFPFLDDRDSLTLRHEF
jgi:predicted amidohydrolase